MNIHIIKSRNDTGSCLFYLYIFHTVSEDEIYELIAGVICLRGKTVEFRKRLFANSDRDEFVSIFSPLLYH